VRTLHVEGVGCAQWVTAWAWQRPLLRSLQQLTVPAPFRGFDLVVEALGLHAPCLNTLCIGSLRGVGRGLASLEGLGRVPALTCVHLRNGLVNAQPLAECTRLEQLELKGQYLRDLHSLLRHLHLRSLRELTLHNCLHNRGTDINDASAPAHLQWRGVLANLCHLHTLTVVDATSPLICSLMEELHSVNYPALRQLLLRMQLTMHQCRLQGRGFDMLLPLARDVLVMQPQLRINLRMIPPDLSTRSAAEQMAASTMSRLSTALAATLADAKTTRCSFTLFQ